MSSIIPSEENLLLYSLLFCRVSALFFIMPIFGGKQVPVVIRVLLSVSMAASLYPLVYKTLENKELFVSSFSYLFYVKELICGAVLGFFCKLIFAATDFAASIVGYQMGFGTANLLSPDSQEQTNSFAILHNIFTVLIFLVFDFHLSN